MSAVRLFVPDRDQPQDGSTVPTIVGQYLSSLAARVAADSFSRDNFLNTERDLLRFAAEFPGQAMDCRQADFEKWIANNSQWKSAHTRKRVVAEVLACFAWAADPDQGNMIASCPLRSIKSIAATPYQPRRAATLNEYLALLAAGSIELQRALTFIYSTGCRPCEMRELIWPWVLLDADTPHLCLAKHKTFRKTGKPKLIGLDDETVQLIRTIQAARTDDDPHVFRNCHGQPWTRRGFSLNVRRAALRAGLDVGVEKLVSAGCLRSTYACDLIESGFTNREVADMLGHTTSWMVDHVYGAATRQRAAHLGNVAKRAASQRKKGR